MNTEFYLYEDLALPYIKQTVQTLMKCRVMWHTILVFTVCKSTHLVGFSIQGNYYTMGCPPVRGDNPRALASGLSFTPIPHRPRIPRIDTNGQIFGFVAESYSVREDHN